MTKIEIPSDCGNAPRKLFLRDLNIAFAKGDSGFVTANIHTRIAWNIVGQKAL